ncbi:hypothetical protein HJC23_006461 [Cyclotella cryptica]|uniref:Uncharacterized protein n=1 Tax=Cyclotella cryptica TaxID=29204 RepID=A0ABD3QUL7_9STRA|eukprot:CCRYP_001882-RA/>CCRYP_001882-RA protein AED:0.00 eAED:0.00 QI:259/-1/1/1/-1/1/1/86/196
MKEFLRANEVFRNRNKGGHRGLLDVALTLTTFVSLAVPSQQLSLSTVISALPVNSWSLPMRRVQATENLSTKTFVKPIAVPSLQVSMAVDRGINGVYNARDPKSIPAGFVRMCHKAGGFAPRPIWDELTNGVTPWFESKDGCFMYFNCHDSRWWIDDSSGSPMYLAVPDESLLLPPINGWVTLTGRKAGAPRMNFI